MRLLQAFPFRFVEPDRVTVQPDGAAYLWHPTHGAFYHGPAPPAFVLLELAGQTAEVYIRWLLGPAALGAQLRLGAIDRVVYAAPAGPPAPLVVTVRRDAVAGRIFRCTCTVTADERVYLTGLLSHVLISAKEESGCRGHR